MFPNARTILNWPFDDPAAPDRPEEQALERFRRVRDEIEATIT